VDPLEALKRRLLTLPAPRRVAGVCPGARAVAVAALLDEEAGAVVVVPTSRDADDLVAGLALLAPRLRCAALAAEGVESYRGHPLPLGASASNAATFGAVAAGRRCDHHDREERN
jgi:hypothetical protein